MLHRVRRRLENIVFGLYEIPTKSFYGPLGTTERVVNVYVQIRVLPENPIQVLKSKAPGNKCLVTAS